MAWAKNEAAKETALYNERTGKVIVEFSQAACIPLAFDIFPGNRNEQTTLKPLEKKIIQDFNCSEFIFCSDAQLGSAGNRAFNSLGNRAYVITIPWKK